MIEVLDDFVPVELANEIEYIFSEETCYWWWQNSTSGMELANSIGYNDSNIVETFQFIHPLLKNGIPNSPYTDISIRLLKIVLDKKNIKPSVFYRIKANLTVPCSLTKDQFNPPHTDISNEKYLSMIYYINESDGDTRFFDNNGNIIQTVKPKKGRCILFNSNILHAGAPPLDFSRRMIINYIFSIDNYEQ